MDQIEETEKLCCTCGYYRQHYGWDGGLYQIQIGHCVANRRPRHTRPYAKACAQWTPQTEEYKHRRLAPAFSWKDLS